MFIRDCLMVAMMIPKKYIAAVLGGSGSVGIHVVKSLIGDPHCEKLILVSRRELDDIKALDPSKVIVHVCDPLDDLASTTSSKVLKGTNVAFCTLGHGSSKNSTQEELLRVDATIPGIFAKVCKDAGVTQYCLMTAVGSDEQSTYNSFTRTAAGGGWYNHVKGVAERVTLEAAIPYTYIAQPAVLLGSPHTPKILEFVPNFILPLNYSSATVSDIATGMVQTTIAAFQNNQTGIVKISGGIPISEGTTSQI